MDEKMNAAIKGIYDSLTDEQKAKAKACKTMDELTLLASKEGIELPDELLDAVAGGYIIYESGTHMWTALSDDGQRRKPAWSKDEAEWLAQEAGWSTEEISEQQALNRLLGYC